MIKRLLGVFVYSVLLAIASLLLSYVIGDLWLAYGIVVAIFLGAKTVLWLGPRSR